MGTLMNTQFIYDKILLNYS